MKFFYAEISKFSFSLRSKKRTIKCTRWNSLYTKFLGFHLFVLSLNFFKTQNIPMFPRVASHWVSYFSFLGRSNDKRVPPCRAFLTWLLRLVTSFQKYEAEIVSWKYSRLGHISAFHLSLRFFYFLCGGWSVWVEMCTWV